MSFSDPTHHPLNSLYTHPEERGLFHNADELKLVIRQLKAPAQATERKQLEALRERIAADTPESQRKVAMLTAHVAKALAGLLADTPSQENACLILKLKVLKQLADHADTETLALLVEYATLNLAD